MDDPDAPAPALPRLLVVSPANAARGPMAQALWERLGGPARSAGTTPASRLHAPTVAALREAGLDIAQRRPRRLVPDDLRWADVVVRIALPDGPGGATALDWDVDDPRDGGRARAVEVLAALDRRLRALAGAAER